MATLADLQKTVIIPAFTKEHGVKNVMQVPRLKKIVINCGMGEALTDKKSIEKMAAQLAVITGQKPQVTRSRRAISTFKLRAGDPIGLRVTLRGRRMEDFLWKFIGIALPRVRDFRGIPAAGFDNQGNYTVGIKEHTIFPELEYNMVDKVRGFEATFVTSAKSREHGRIFLTLLGMPFVKE